MFLTMDQVRTHLGIPSTSSTVDADDLQSFAAAACDVVEQWCGAIEPRTVTDERVASSASAVALAQCPVSALVGVSAAGAPVGVVGDYLLNSAGGILTRVDGGVIAAGSLVTYTVGYAVPPPWAVVAAKIIVRHLWRTQRTPNAIGSAEPPPGAGFAVPAAAAAIMSPHRRLPGFA